jgi:hypothetical protein
MPPQCSPNILPCSGLQIRASVATRPPSCGSHGPHARCQLDFFTCNSRRCRHRDTTCPRRRCSPQRCTVQTKDDLLAFARFESEPYIRVRLTKALHLSLHESGYPGWVGSYGAGPNVVDGASRAARCAGVATSASAAIAEVSAKRMEVSGVRRCIVL